MEPFNARLHEVLMDRWDGMGDDERRATMTLLACDRPATVVRAMNQAQRLAEEVEETLRG